MRKIIVVTAVGGLIATVGGGLILSFLPKSSDLFAQVGTWAWSSVYGIWSMLGSSHSIPGWAILAAGLLALVGLITVGISTKESLQGSEQHPYRDYTEVLLDGVRWRWRWKGNTIQNLWCYCPRCDAQLVYNEGFAETRFICERCPSDGSLPPTGPRGRVVLTVPGGDRRYAVAAAEREIRRRIRTGEI